MKSLELSQEEKNEMELEPNEGLKTFGSMCVTRFRTLYQNYAVLHKQYRVLKKIKLSNLFQEMDSVNFRVGVALFRVLDPIFQCLKVMDSETMNGPGDMIAAFAFILQQAADIPEDDLTRPYMQSLKEALHLAVCEQAFSGAAMNSLHGFSNFKSRVPFRVSKGSKMFHFELNSDG